jgi:hypothetical protein
MILKKSKMENLVEVEDKQCKLRSWKLLCKGQVTPKSKTQVKVKKIVFLRKKKIKILGILIPRL